MKYAVEVLSKICGGPEAYAARLDENVAVQILGLWFVCEMRQVSDIEHVVRLNPPRMEKKWLTGPRTRRMGGPQPYPKGQRRPSAMVAMMNVTSDTGMCGSQAIRNDDRPLREHLFQYFKVDGEPKEDILKLIWTAGAGEQDALFRGEMVPQFDPTYRGWELTYSTSRPETGWWIAEHQGITVCSGTEAGVKRSVDGRIRQYPASNGA